MTRPTNVLRWMVIFVALVGAGAMILAGPLSQAFLSNAWFNGLIVAILVIGIGINFRQVAALYPEIDWIESYQQGAPGRAPQMLSSMASLMSGHATSTISTTSLRTLLDSIHSRLEESRDLPRYLAGLLIFLGLLGTFWGLMATVGSVSDAVNALSIEGTNTAKMFDDLKRNLRQPLTGMGVAFSSSLFGLTGALIVGFLDLQAGHAQNRFVNELEEWLSGNTRLSSGFLGEESMSSPSAYMEALLEKTSDTLERMQRSNTNDNSHRERLNTRLADLGDCLSQLNHQLELQNERLERLATSQTEIPRLLERLDERDSSASFSEELRSELRLLNKTIANALAERDR